MTSHYMILKLTLAMIKDYCSNEDYKDLLMAYLDKNLNDTIDYQ